MECEMAFTKKKKAPILPKAEQERIKKILEDEAVRFKRPTKMQFIYKTPSGIQLVETARFRNEDEGLAYGKQKEDQLKKLNKKWKLVSSQTIKSLAESQQISQD